MHSGRGMTETSSGPTRWRHDARSEGAVRDNPFALLGLPTRPGLSDDDVRAAWRRIAAATHPDREDGGDPARFGAVAAAYAMLRTGFGRGEALADLGLGGTAEAGGRHAHRRGRPADVSVRAGRHRARRAEREQGSRGGSPAQRRGGLTLRMIGAGAVGVLAVVILGWSPGVVGVLAGVLTWLVATAGRVFWRRRSQ